MDPGLVSEGFLIDPPEHLPLVLNGLLWEFPNKHATQGGSFLIFLSFLGIIPLLDSLRRDLKDKWFRLWCQTRTSLLSRHKRSSVDHRLSTSSLVSSDPTASLSTSSKLVGIWYGLSVRVRRSSLASRILPWPQIRILQVSPQGSSLVRSSRVEDLGGSEPFWYLTIYVGDRCPMEPSLMSAEGSDRA